MSTELTPPEFKANQRVRVTADETRPHCSRGSGPDIEVPFYLAGDTGTVLDHMDPLGVFVDFDGRAGRLPGNWWVEADRLELIKENEA